MPYPVGEGNASMTPTKYKLMNDNETTATLIGRLVGGLLSGALITAALHFAFAFSWPQALVLTWLYCLLKSEVESINKRTHL